MDCFGNKWLINLFLLSEGLYLTTANNLFASEGEAMQLNCPYNKVNSWQSVTNDFLVLCEGDTPMINENLSISNRIRMSRNCTIMTITNFTKEDAATYVCYTIQKDKNNADEYIQHKIHVKLRLKPTVFILVLSNSSVAEIDKSVILRQNQHIELKCLEKTHSTGDVVIFSWLFNKISLENNTNKILFINMKPEMSGEYICRAQNRAGIHYDSLNITVADIPEMPQNFRVVALKHEIIVKWLAGNSGGILQTFLIEYRNRFESAWNVIMITTEGKTSEVIDGLQMDTVYFIRMFSRNILGESNTTDEIIIKTGNHHIVIKSCSWEIGVLGSVAVVVFLICLCGIKATQQRLCLNMVQNRRNRPQSNANTPETRDAQYDEIDSVYYNVPNDNGRPELALNNTPNEALLSSINSRNIGNITTDYVETGNVNQDLTQSDTNLNILRADNVSVSTSSGDSYLVPSRNYINLAIGFTDELSHQIAEPEFLDGGSSASNSESSDTRIKSAHKYETLDATNSVEHYYESTI